MTGEEARQIVRALLHEVAPDADLDNVSSDATLQESLGLDSLDFLAFVDRLHERTGIEIPERDYPRLLTIDDCVSFLVSATLPGQSPT
ncbi:MAG: phosphopantetheine-binding protein [Actinomycetota bacterium]|jgi:acyl carrier protein|nr:phosphopantetheine-binding protein [Actinomycetota bacterium]MDA8313563.1 phosphopantetheine-binding protein [Actinomycetota bacterium]